MKPQHIIVVDDHPIVADSLGMALTDMGYVVRLALNARDLRCYLADSVSLPDLIVLDIALPDADGINLISEIRMAYGIPILVFSASSEARIMHTCERNGAAGFVCKDVKPEILISGIAEILSGGQFFPTIYTDWLKRAMERSHALNYRQEQVLKLIIAGERNKEIADNLNLAGGTVKNIVTELLQHFHVDSRQKLILAALETGYKPRISSMDATPINY